MGERRQRADLEILRMGEPEKCVAGQGSRSSQVKAWDQAAYMRQYRARMGNRQLSMQLRIDSAAALVYLKSQWGFKSTAETVNTALVYLSRQTREGLQTLDIASPLEV